MADLYTPYRNYVKKMLTFQGREKGTAKVLILDNDTVGCVRVESLSRVDAVVSCSIFSKRDSRLRWLEFVFMRSLSSFPDREAWSRS